MKQSDWWDNIKDVYLPANYTSVDDFSDLETEVSGKVNASDSITDAQIDALFSSGQQQSGSQGE